MPVSNAFTGGIDSTADKGNTGIKMVDRHAALYAIFEGMDGDNSGQIDSDEFKSIFTEAGEKEADDRMKEMDSSRGRGNSDGVLDRDEFCEFMLEYMYEKSDAMFNELMRVWNERLAGSARKLLLRRVFSRMDADKSGSVDLEEFGALHEEDVGDESAIANFFRWIEGACGNSDGTLTSDEWVPFVLELEKDTSDEDFRVQVDDWLMILEKKRRTTLLKQLFRKMDADSSGEVDLHEFKQLVADDGQQTGGDGENAYERSFHFLDGMGNADGLLSMEEWVKGMQLVSADYDNERFEGEIAGWHAVLTRNQRKMWRNVFAKGNAKKFLVALQATGATHALFVRHANAAPLAAESPPLSELSTDAEKKAHAEWKRDDVSRPLTNRGQAQCMVARDEWFGRLPVRRVLIASPAQRATETATHMAGKVESAANGEGETDRPIVMVERMHPAGQQAECEQLFAQKGYGPLRTFLDAAGGETAFSLYAESVCAELTTQFRTNAGGRDKSGGTYLSLFGHAVFLNAVAYALAVAAGAAADGLDAMLDFDLGEAEGLLVPLFGGAPQHLRRPS